MLQTPLGNLEVRIDNRVIDYDCWRVPIGDFYQDLDGRYAIKVSFQPDKMEHTISCRIKDYVPSAEDGPESGENLELFSFYWDRIKLSIGMEGDTCYFDGQRLSNYDYDTEYLKDGVQYLLLPITETSKYVFGIAWINEVTDVNDVKTWYGADPTLIDFIETDKWQKL